MLSTTRWTRSSFTCLLIASGLDYPGVGPQHCYLKDIGRVNYHSATDRDAVEAFYGLSRMEGIIPALESSHAVAYAIKKALELDKDKIILVNLSGRGDKDIDFVMENYPLNKLWTRRNKFNWI